MKGVNVDRYGSMGSPAMHGVYDSTLRDDIPYIIIPIVVSPSDIN